MYAAFYGSKNELVNFTLPTKALPMGLPILQEARKKRQKGEENPTNNSNRGHTKLISNTLVNVLLKKTTTTKPQDLKYKLEVVNNQERGFEGRRMAPHPSGDTANMLPHLLLLHQGFPQAPSQKINGTAIRLWVTPYPLLGLPERK